MAANNYGQGCRGGEPYKAFSLMMNDTKIGNYHNGALLEKCMKYQARDNLSCNEKDENWEEFLVPIANCSEICFGLDFDKPENIKLTKSLIYENGSLVSVMNITIDFIYWGKIHHDPTEYYPYKFEPWANNINHVIIFLGWKDDPTINNGGYWICKNSYGTEWGYEGFFNIEYGTIFSGMGIVLVDYESDRYNWEPVAYAGGFYYSNINDIIDFDGSKCFDAENENLSYHWEFGDGQESFDISPSHKYEFEGIYHVNLTVVDENNNTGIDTTIVGIVESPLEIKLKGGIGLNVIIKNPSKFKIDKKYFTFEIIGGYLKPLISINRLIDIIPGRREYIINIPILGFGMSHIFISLENYHEMFKIFSFGPLAFLINLYGL